MGILIPTGPESYRLEGNTNNCQSYGIDLLHTPFGFTIRGDAAGETGHLNMKTEGYSWTRIGQAKVNGNVSINQGVYDPQATRVNTMALQVCHERTAIPDKCGTYNYNR